MQIRISVSGLCLVQEDEEGEDDEEKDAPGHACGGSGARGLG